MEGWENMEEVWESVLGVAESEKRCVGESEKRCGKVRVLGCRGSSLKRGVGKERRDGGVKKCRGGVRKCVADVGEGVEKWRVGKYGEGVGKCFGCGRK